MVIYENRSYGYGYFQVIWRKQYKDCLNICHKKTIVKVFFVTLPFGGHGVRQLMEKDNEETYIFNFNIDKHYDGS